MNIIPFQTPGSWTMQITLSSVIFNLQFYWNTLNQYWLMDINDSANMPIVVGVVVVTNFDITKQFAALTGMPAGDIVCQNILGGWENIGRFDMGETNELIYYDQGQLTTTANAELALEQQESG